MRACASNRRRGGGEDARGRRRTTRRVLLPTQQDVVTAVVGASAALAGMTLVFLGLIVTAFRALPGDTVQAVRARYRTLVWPIFGVFAVEAATIALGVMWLALAGGDLVYAFALVFFWIELAGMV